MSEFEHPIKDVTDSLLGWATQAELELAQRLNHPNVTIIGDLDLASDEVERIEKLYGIFLARQLAAGGNLAELTALRETVAGLHGTAAAGDPAQCNAEVIWALALDRGHGVGSVMPLPQA